jgi:hypothetical protein
MRVFNRLLVLALGVAIAAAGVLVILEAIWTWTNSGFVWIPGREWLNSFKTTPWSAPIVIAVSIAVAAAGFVLVVAEVRPQRKRHAPFSTDDQGNWLLLRRSTEAHLQRRLAAQVPVSPIKVRLKPRALRWQLKVTARAAPTTKPALVDAAQSELGRLHAPSASKVDVTTTGATKAS